MHKEIWKDIEHFDGYQVSNYGRVRSFWVRKHYPTGYGCYWIIGDIPRIINGSDDGNGYLKVMLYCHEDGRRYCKKIHKLVADAFLPNEFEDESVEYTVDHIRSGPNGKLDNSVWNLRWMTRLDNIRKAYIDGMCDDRILHQQVSIVAFDDWTGLTRYYHSIKEAARDLRLNQSTVTHAIGKGRLVAKRYYFERAGREDKLLYEQYDLQFIPWI